MITLAQIGPVTRAVFYRLRSDSAGEIVRSALPSGANGVMHARKLPKIQSDLQVEAPLLAMRRGGIATIENTIHAMTFRWWIYDYSDEDYFRISDIANKVSNAYDPRLHRLMSSVGPLGQVDVSIGDEAEDPTLGMPYVIVTVVVYC